MMEFFGWLETPATAAGPVVNHTRFCRWGCFHQAGFAHSACGARFKSPTRIEVCRFLSESLIKTRPYEKTTANVVTDGWMMKLQTVHCPSAVLAVKGSLRRAQYARALDGLRADDAITRLSAKGSDRSIQHVLANERSFQTGGLTRDDLIVAAVIDRRYSRPCRRRFPLPTLAAGLRNPRVRPFIRNCWNRMPSSRNPLTTPTSSS